MYNIINGTRIFKLLCDIYHVTQGMPFGSAYYRRLKILWDYLAAIDDLVLLYEEDIVILAKSKEPHKMIQFLLRLNDTYSYTRTKFLMRQPLPNLSVVYSIIFQEENQRSIVGSITNGLAYNCTTLLSNSSRRCNSYKVKIDKSGW